MKDITDLAGIFWLPDEPDRRMHGSLHRSPDGDTLRLTLPEVAHYPDLDHQPAIPRLLGVIEGGDEVTILDAVPTGGWETSNYAATVSYWQFSTLFGAHTEVDGYRQLSITFDWLGEWSPVRKWSEVKGDRRVEFDTSSHRIAMAEVGDARISLDRHVSWRSSGTEVSGKAHWSFVVEGEGAISESSADWVQPLQDFLMVALGHRPGILKVEAEILESHPYPRWVEVRPSWPRLGPAEASPRLIRYLAQSKTLLLPDDELLELGSALARWFDSQAELRVAVSMLSAGLRDAHTALEHRFLSLFLALDALARLSGEIDSLAVPKAVHSARTTAIASVLAKSDLTPEIRDWANERLRNGNGKSQAVVLGEFLQLTGLVPLDKSMTIARRLNDFRTDIAHRGVIRDVDSDDVILEVVHLAELVEWIVRAEIVARLGMPRNRIQERMTANSSFQDVLAARKWRSTRSPEKLTTNETIYEDTRLRPRESTVQDPRR